MSTYGDSDAKPRLRTKIRVMPPAQTIKRLAHEAHFGKGSFNELVQSGPRYKVGRLSHGRRTNAVSSGGAGLTAQKAARSGGDLPKPRERSRQSSNHVRIAMISLHRLWKGQ
jgi:hypothetical protein